MLCIFYPLPDYKIYDPISFFKVSPDNLHPPRLTNINFEEEAVFEALSHLSGNSAPGPDGMQASIFKNCAAELALPLSLVFKKMFMDGFIPASMKRGAVVPIFKGGDKSCPANYRPISLTPILMKVFERIVRREIVTF